MMSVNGTETRGSRMRRKRMNAMSAVLKKEEDDVLPDDCDAPIDHGWAWMVCLGTFVSLMICTGTFSAYGVLTGEFMEEFKVSATESSWMAAVDGLVAAVLAPLGGFLSDKWSNRVVVMFGGMLCAAGAIGAAFATDMGIVVFTYGALIGGGSMFAMGASQAITGKYFNKHRSFANGIALAGEALGILIMPPLIRLLVDEYGLRGGLLILGAIQLNVILSGAVLRPLEFYKKRSSEGDSAEEAAMRLKPPRSPHKVAPEDASIENELLLKGGFVERDAWKADEKDLALISETSPCVAIWESSPCLSFKYPDAANGDVVKVPTGTEKRVNEEDDNNNEEEVIADSEPDFPPTTSHQRKSYWRRQWDGFAATIPFCRNPLFQLFIIGMIFGNFGQYNQYFVIVPYAEEIGLSKQEAAAMMSFVGGSELVGRLFLGWFADLRIISKIHIVQFSYVVTGLFAMILPFFPYYGVLVAYCIVFGFFGGSVLLFLVALVADIVGLRHLNMSIGIAWFFVPLSFMIGSPVVGALKDVTDSYMVSMRLCGGFYIAGAIVFAFEPPLRRCLERWAQEHAAELEGEASRKVSLVEHESYV